MENRTLRFGVFELALPAGELRKSGTRIKLQEQPLRILEMLLDRPGQVVSRDEMRDQLWPAGISVDFDRSLNTAVNKLREALGDSAQSPRFIETIPRRGYRFIAPVEQLEKPGLQPAVTQRPRSRLLLWLAAGLVLSVLIVVWLRERRRIEPLHIEPRPLTSYAGIEVQPSFSPDGSQVAFSWNGEREDNFDIYVKAIGAERPLRLTTAPEPDLSPAWSPRGDLIAFIRSRGDVAGVYIVPATGGAERHLTDLHLPVLYYLPIQLAWMPDGANVVAPDQQAGGKPPALFVWSLKTGQKRQITFPPVESGGDHSPSISPDGQSLLFSRGPFADPRLYRTSLAAPEKAAAVNAGGVDLRNGVWIDAGRAIVAVGGMQHFSALWLLSAVGQHPAVPLVRYPASQPAAAPSSPHLAYTRTEWDANIWRLSTKEGMRSARPLITSTYLDHLPSLSPDGNRIAFVSTRSGAQGLYVCDAGGSSILKLTSASRIAVVRWSPAGDRLVFAATNDSHNEDIYLIRSDGSGLQRLTTDPAAEVGPAWSTDGQWIYFGSNRTGSFDIWKMRPAGGQPERVTRNGGYHALESKDGRFLYYTKQDSDTPLWRQPVHGGPEELILPFLSTAANFAILENGIVYIPGIDAAQRSNIEFLNFATNKTEILLRLEKRPVWGLSAQRDVILFTQVDRESTDLMMIDSVPQF